MMGSRIVAREKGGKRMDYRGDFAPYAGSLDSRCSSQRHEVKTIRRTKVFGQK